MSITTYKTEKNSKKKVIFSNDTGASVTLRGGYAVCYEHDVYTVAHAYTVIRPATSNLRYFAGSICEQEDGKIVADGKTVQIEIYVPNQWGQVVPVWIAADHSGSSVNLEITAASFVFVEGSTTKVARTVQRVNRNTTNGTCLARLYGVSHAKALA